MEDYLSMYGWHFSKKMCEWASSKMYKKDNSYIDPYTRDQIDTFLKTYGITLKNAKGYDDVYIANMCKADFLGSSIRDEFGVIQYVKDVIDDADGYEGMPFTRFYADCIGSGTPIPWEEVI